MGHRIHSTERLADPGTLLATTHPVGGGLRVRPRLARPSDAAGLRGFLEGLSPTTRERRFARAMPIVPEATVRSFTFYDPRERLVVAATAMLGGGSLEEIVGLADLTHLSGGLAELAVVVGDLQQNRGVGKLLTEVIGALAMQQGATRLKARMAEPDPAMTRLMQRLGRTMSTVEDGVTVMHATLPGARRRDAA